MNGEPILHVPPPGAQWLGTGTDLGSDSSIIGRAPQIESVFATRLSVTDVQAYYEQHYPQYEFGAEFSTSPGHKLKLLGHVGEIRSGGDWFNVGVIINDYEPDVSQEVKIDLRPRRSGYRTFVVVYAHGTAF